MTDLGDTSAWPALDPEGSSVSLDAFDPALERWVAMPAREEAASTRPTTMLDIATWNIWFSTWRKQERLELLLESLVSRPRDIITLQEITRDALERIAEHTAIREKFAITGAATAATLDANQGYGNITLVSHKLARHATARIHRFSTNQGRVLLLVELGDGTLVANTHLESKRGNGIVREEQIRDLLSITRDAPLIWAGDFNFAPDFDEQEILPDDLEDAWVTCHPDDPGYTIDSDQNPILHAIGRKSKHVRFDRVLTRGLTARECAIIGADKSETDPILRPSDHFGLEAKVVRRSQDRSRETSGGG